MDLRDLNIQIPNTKSSNSVVINTEYWIANTSNMIIGVDKKNKVAMNYITPILARNIQDEKLKELDIMVGDVILLTKFGSQFVQRVYYQLPMSNIKYGNVHATQIIGRFDQNNISLDSLITFTNYVVCKETKVDSGSSFLRTDEFATTTVGEVVKCSGKRFDKDLNIFNSEIKIGDKVVVIDNTTTNIMLDGEPYMCSSEDRIVGKLNGDKFNLDNLEPLHDKIIMKECKDEKIEGFEILYAPVEDLEHEDATSNYNEDKFTVLKVGSDITFVKSGDTVYCCRDMANYLILGGERYFVLDGIDFIYGKVEGE